MQRAGAHETERMPRLVVSNTELGGDSAARGMVVGMIMKAAGKKVPDSRKGERGGS